MPAVVTKWPESRRPEVEAALRESSTVREAAERMGITEPTLRGAFKAWRLGAQEYNALLKRAEPVAPPPSPAAFSCPAEEPNPEPEIDWTGARPATTGTGLERRLIGTDLHIPFHNLRACAGFLALARAIQPHLVLLGGDVFNMGAVSHHPRPFGGRESHDRARVLGYSFLDALARAAPRSRKLLLKGNHDDWADEFEDANPEFAGMFAAQSMGLDRLGWEVVPRSRQPLVLGPVAYLHGYGGGEHFAKRYALDVAPAAGVKVVVVGHHHSFQRFHAKNGAECWGAGWLGDKRHSAFDYAKNRDHWELGCLVQDVIGEHVTTTPIRLDGGAALFGGRLVAA